MITYLHSSNLWFWLGTSNPVIDFVDSERTSANR